MPARPLVPMALRRDDFDAPVVDYSFSEAKDVSSLIDQMAKAGGFSATKLAHARDVLSEAINKSNNYQISQL